MVRPVASTTSVAAGFVRTTTAPRRLRHAHPKPLQLNCEESGRRWRSAHIAAPQWASWRQSPDGRLLLFANTSSAQEQSLRGVLAGRLVWANSATTGEVAVWFHAPSDRALLPAQVVDTRGVGGRALHSRALPEPVASAATTRSVADAAPADIGTGYLATALPMVRPAGDRGGVAGCQHRFGRDQGCPRANAP